MAYWQNAVSCDPLNHCYEDTFMDSLHNIIFTVPGAELSLVVHFLLVPVFCFVPTPSWFTMPFSFYIISAMISCSTPGVHLYFRVDIIL